MKSRSTKPSSPLRKKPGRDSAETGSSSFPVVAIGASAGGLEAYKELFRALPVDTGMAFVLIQHLDPSHHSLLAEILSKSTRMPVEEVKSGVRIKPDRVYVIPPGSMMAIAAGAFALTPRNKQKGEHLSVNFFMRSLAEERKSSAIGVILSGTGADGTLGLENIKAEGGITFAQDPATANYDGMPRNAIDSGCVDFVLSPKDIAQELLRIHSHPYIREDPRGAQEQAKELEDSVAVPSHEEEFIIILDQLRKTSGVDFRQYKPNTIHRRALRRSVILKLDSLGAYAKYLKEHPEEGHKLYDDVLIPVTSFFRDFEAFEALKSQVYPHIVQDKQSKGIIRMWAPGCSTGEETYSLAMTLIEYLGDKATSFQVQIFGTDLNEKGIQKARAGVYRGSIAEEVSQERLQRFFVKVDEGYRVNKAVRDMCVFARQNLAADPPFSQMNVVACRNLLIYIQPALQKKIIPILHYALKPSGFLVLGSSESVASFPDLFSAVDKKHKIYSKKPVLSRLHYDFAQNYYPATAGSVPGKAPKPQIPTENIQFDVQAEADRAVLQNHTPVGVVINDSMEIVQFRGRTTPYLEPAPGKPSLNVLKMARNGLAMELRQLIAAARKDKVAVRKAGVSFNDNGRQRAVNLSVLPLAEKTSRNTQFFVVLFEDNAPSKPSADGASPDTAKGDSRSKLELKRLQRELAETQETLRSALEAEESMKEEFQSANEEILSANEELQSTNEELETSKEELQSTNEELSTVNAELRHKNIDLHDLTNDISNLLNSTRIPLVMLDPALRIRRVTPMADKLLKVRPSDIGRSIADIRLNIDEPELESMIAGVLDTLQPAERDVRGLDDRWYCLSILPYRTQDNRINGVVLALQDIDAIKDANLQLSKSAEFFRFVVNTVVEPLLVLDSELRVVMASDPFLRTFQVSAEETHNKFLYNLGNGQWNIPRLRTLLEEILPDHKTVRGFVVEHEFESIGRRTMIVNAHILTSPVGENQIFFAIEDVTERNRAEQSMARLAAIVESSDDAIIGTDLDGKIETWNSGAERLFGYSREEAIGQPITMLIPPDWGSEATELLDRIHRGEHVEHYESVRRRKDGKLLDVSLTISPIIDLNGRVVGASKIARDITQRKLAETALLKSEKLAAAGRLAATLAHEINNPLQAVINLVCLWRLTSTLDDEGRQYASMVEDELRRVNHLTQQSLTFYREAAFPTVVDVRDVVQSVLDLYATRLSAKGINLTTALPPDGTKIKTHPGEIRQVFTTLLLNAVEAVPSGGVIAVRIREATSWNARVHNGVRVTIADSGVGIPSRNAARIFEPFFTTKGEQGTGLGLWVAGGIVSRLGGSIQMRSSVQPGKSGTCFSFFLPSHAPSRRSPDGSPDGHSDGSSS